MTPQELERLIDGHEVEMYRYLRYLGARENLAEDLVQESFLAAYRAANPPPLGEARRCGAWLRTIARNLYISHLRKQAHNVQAAEPAELERAEVWWSSRREQESKVDELGALDECLEHLPTRSRALIDASYSQKQSRAEMAARFAMSEGGIKTALRRIRAALYECIQVRLRRGSEVTV